MTLFPSILNIFDIFLVDYTLIEFSIICLLIKVKVVKDTVTHLGFIFDFSFKGKEET